jgi:hypothetical protein
LAALTHHRMKRCAHKRTKKVFCVLTTVNSEKLIHLHIEHCIEPAASPTHGRRKLPELLVVLERYVE